MLPILSGIFTYTTSFPKNLCYNLHLLILGYNVLYILCYERIPERINILLNLMFMI